MFFFLRNEKKVVLLQPQIAKPPDLVAQQVEHHTFNVGVLGSSPSQVTNIENQSIMADFLFFGTKNTHLFPEKNQNFTFTNTG